MKDETARRIVNEVLEIAERFGEFVPISGNRRMFVMEAIRKDDGTRISQYELMVKAVQRIINEVTCAVATD